MNHSPSCTQPPPTITHGYSVTITRCPECGAIETVRHGTLTTPTVTS